MNSVDIKELENIKDKLESLEEDDILFVDDDGEIRYVLMPVEHYDYIEEVVSQTQNMMPRIKIINSEDFELTYDEYEAVKKQLNDMIEKTFKPKPEKLN